MAKIRKYLPIRVFSDYFAYGYWWGKYCFFFGKKSTCFGIVPLDYVANRLTYASNYKLVGNGDCASWSEERQRDNERK